MKRIGNIYEEMLSTKRIEEVFEDIKSRCKNKGNVIEFLLNKNSNINSILNDLSNYSYKFNKYSIFLIKEPKYRIIMSSSINDKIVNHLVSSYILLPSLESSLCEENTATRKGKGSAYARKLLLRHINTLKHNNKEIYVLKLDISKYFYNIDHNILLNKINNKIKDKNALKIIKDILDITNNEYINK
ncbi:MAG: reverse transcriptase domain-containing protein, partial [Bacilli bacterium]